MVLQILAALGLPSSSLAFKDLAEDLPKMRLARARKIKTLETKTPTGLPSRLFQDTLRVKAVHVIELPLHGIAEDLIGFRHPLEAFLGQAITRIDVRMIAPGEFPKGFLDFVNRSRSKNLKDYVKLVSTGHD